MPEEGNSFDGSAFGYPVQIPPDEGPDPFADDAQTSEASQPQPRDNQGRFASTDVEPVAEPAATEPQAPAEPIQPEGVAQDTAQEPSEPAQAEVPLASDIPQQQVDWERRYRDTQASYTRGQQELAEMRARQGQYEEALAEMIAFQQQSRAATDPEYAQRVDAERAIAPLIEQRLAPLQQRLEQQMQGLEIARLQMGVDSAIGQFRSRHPEVQDGTPEDESVAHAVKTLHDAWTRVGEELDLSDPNSLELAYEVTQDPYLLAIHAANPTLSNSDEGMEYARWQAQQLASLSRQKQAGTPAAQVTKVQSQAAYVETNAQRSPQKAEGEGDEFDEVMRVDKQLRTSNPFVGGKNR